MRALAVLAGKVREKWAREIYAQGSFDLVIAADKGLLTCQRAGIRADYVLGDFDGFSREVALSYARESGAVLETYPPEKDRTDADIALEKAADAGADEIWLIGATGGRLDHELSNLHGLVKLKKRKIRGYILDEQNRISVPLENRVVLRKEQQYGSYISFLPIGGEVEKLSLEGFAYSLKDYTMKAGDGGLTISNSLIAAEGILVYHKGDLMIIESKDL